MCTLNFSSCEFAQCFCEANDPKACGTQYCSTNNSCCTRHKFFEVDDLEVKVQVPSVDDMYFRSACCCSYCGCAFGPLIECCACRDASYLLGCCDLRSGWSCLDSSQDRACCKGISMAKACSCDKPDEPASGYESVLDSTFLCLFKCERMFRCTFMPHNCTCLNSKCQRCCMYQKCAFPVTDEVPCEIGCCGIFCCNKKEAIKVFEVKNPDLVGFNRIANGAPIAPETELISCTAVVAEEMTKRHIHSSYDDADEIDSVHTSPILLDTN